MQISEIKSGYQHGHFEDGRITLPFVLFGLLLLHHQQGVDVLQNGFC